MPPYLFSPTITNNSNIKLSDAERVIEKTLDTYMGSQVEEERLLKQLYLLLRLTRNHKLQSIGELANELPFSIIRETISIEKLEEKVPQILQYLDSRIKFAD